jgi:PAS domain S-box-containing protein
MEVGSQRTKARPTADCGALASNVIPVQHEGAGICAERSAHVLFGAVRPGGRPLSGIAGRRRRAPRGGSYGRRGHVTSWSSGAEALLGYTSAEIIGRPLADLVAPDGSPRHRSGRLMKGSVRLCPLGEEEGQTGFLVILSSGEADPEGPEDGQLMRCVFDQQPYAFAVYDLDGRVLSANEVMLRAAGLSMEETRGRRLTEFLQGHAFEETEQRILRVAETGEPELLEHYVRLPGEDKSHAWAVDIFPLKGAMGRVQAVGVAASDYSQQYGSRERLALMSEARTRIGGSLDIGGTAQELAEVVVPRFADSVSVDLLEPVFRGETPPVRVGGHPVLRRAGDRGPNDRSALPGLGDREAHIDPDALPVAECLGGRTVTREESGTSFIAVPIRTPDAVLGIAVFVRSEKSREPFGPDDVAVTEDLVARLAVCLDNARRFTRERGIALALQRAMLPRRPALAAVETVSRYLPAGNGSRTGGDWFDVIPLPGARVGLVIGDVVGHGIAASATRCARSPTSICRPTNSSRTLMTS